MFDLQDVEEQAVLHGGLIDREREFFLRAIDGVFGEGERAEGEALRDALLPKLMSGEVDVSDVQL